uniref:Uncharacterized protein n=1 Tax=Micrurus surinamensis TaxID=129470 RepID=A0A2D4P2M8_MICSU
MDPNTHGKNQLFSLPECEECRSLLDLKGKGIPQDRECCGEGTQLKSHEVTAFKGIDVKWAHPIRSGWTGRFFHSERVVQILQNNFQIKDTILWFLMRYQNPEAGIWTFSACRHRHLVCSLSFCFWAVVEVK